MAEVRTLKVLGLATLAFVLATLGQISLNMSLKINGWILYTSAVALFIIVFPHCRVARFAGEHLVNTPVETPRPSRLFWLLLVLAVFASLGGVVLFSESDNSGVAWSLHIASVLLLIFAFKSFYKLRRPTLLTRGRLATLLVQVLPIVLVVILAAFARFWQIDQFPFGTWYDEAFNGNLAAQILDDSSFRPIFYGSDTLPSHLAYLFALSFWVFGISTAAMRYITAAFGILTVVFAYLLFRRWFGEQIGLVSATLCAVMRYDLTFSRIAISGVTTPAFELVVLYFLDRALDRKQWSEFAWMGLALGFGLAFYTPFRLFPLALAIFMVCVLIAALAKYGARETNKRYLKRMFPHWTIALLTLMIAAAPITQFALRNPEVFFARTNTVSIFEKRDEPDLGQALLNNTFKHLEMFNLRGDANGRHNLPAAPMLDPVMGVLFILGLTYATWHWRDPANLLMLLVFVVMLQGGILSLDFEAPQSQRAIGVIPALVYFITLPIAAVTQYVAHAFRRGTLDSQISISTSANSNIGIGILGVGIGILLTLITHLNLSTFFDKQKNDPEVWAAYSTAETIAANEMNRLASSHDFVLSALYYDHPTVPFLAANITNRQRWTVTDRLPLVRDETGRGVVLMFDENLLSAYNDARRIYPNAKFTEHHAPAGGGTVMYEVILTPGDLRAVSGVVAYYFKGDAVEGKPVKEEALKQIDLDWTRSQPLSGSFVAEFRSTLYVQQYGSYRFSVRGASGATLWIDENYVSDTPLMLARGNHLLRLQVRGNAKKVELWWQPPSTPEAQLVPAANLFRPPVANSGLLGAYYPSPDWSGDPAFLQIDPEIAFYFHIVPLPRPYTAKWQGKLFAPTAGDYRFALSSIDGSQLTLDQRRVVDNPNGHTTIEGVTQLTQGWHDITVRFSDKTAYTQIYLYWTPPGANRRELVPTRYLSPPMGQYPAAP